MWGRIPAVEDQSNSRRRPASTTGRGGGGAGGGGAPMDVNALGLLSGLGAQRWVEWSTPTMVPGTEGLDVTAVAVGARHAAAVVRNQGVYTWGDAAGGRLGHGTFNSCVR